MFKPYKHQQEALDAILETDAAMGRIVIPTGGGKTMVQAYALREFVNEDGMSVHVVLAPRIALVNQLIKEYRNFIGQNYVGWFEIAVHNFFRVRISQT